MKAYANPAASRTAKPGDAAAPASAARTLEHVAGGTAARLGAIAGGLIWVLGAIVATVFDLFSINLWHTVIEGRWVASPGWESLAVFMANFGGLVIGAVGVILFGALAGALTAWIYNLTAPTPAPDEDYF
jgi:hypothetical protein